MSQTLPNGITSPINSDAYNLTGDLATMGNSANVIIPVANQAARDALTAVAGMVVLRLDTGGLEGYISGAWNLLNQITGASPYMVHAGQASISIASGIAAGTASVTFPTAFTQAPIITATVAIATGNNSYKFMAHAYNNTTTGFTLDARTIDGTGAAASYTLPVNWIAIQMTPASAAG